MMMAMNTGMVMTMIRPMITGGLSALLVWTLKTNAKTNKNTNTNTKSQLTSTGSGLDRRGKKDSLDLLGKALSSHLGGVV